MDLRNQRTSHNVEDRRGMGMAAGGLGVGGIVIALIAYFLGVDPAPLLEMTQPAGGGSSAQEAPRGAPADETGQFVSKVLGSTEDTWSVIFQRSGSEYRAPTLVLYEGQVRSACGMGRAAMGPFYCPGDEKLYIDLSFFRDLHARFRAPGDFAQAYVIAHEVAHHVQRLTGGFRKLEAARGRVSQAEFNRLSVRMELQADCYAGVWGHHAGTMNQLERGDIEEALGAATHRRRSAAEADPRARRAGILHARQLGAARALVQARSGLRQPRELRHLQRCGAVISARRGRSPRGSFPAPRDAPCGPRRGPR